MNSSPEFDDIFGRMTKDLSLTNFTCGKTQVPKKFGGKIPEVGFYFIKLTDSVLCTP